MATCGSYCAVCRKHLVGSARTCCTAGSAVRTVMKGWIRRRLVCVDADGHSLDGSALQALAAKEQAERKAREEAERKRAARPPGFARGTRDGAADHTGQRVAGALPGNTGTPTPVEGRSWMVPDLGMEFVWIPALMSWVGKYEVTNHEYREKEPAHDSKEHQGHGLNGDRQPAVRVDFDDACAYAVWLTQRERALGRLPDGLRSPAHGG